MERWLLICVALFLTLSFSWSSKATATPSKSSERVLSADDIKFGQNQVSQMLLDRPRMEKYVKKDGPIWTWVARQFAGDCTGARYYWRASPVYNGPKQSIACHYFPISDNTRWISVYEIDADGYAPDGEQMWAGLIFELFNIRNDPEYKSLTQQALDGKLSKSEYVKRSLECEYKARKELSAFYRELWKPIASKDGITTHDAHWFVDVPPTFEQWYETSGQHMDLSFYDYFYESEIVPRIKASGQK